MFDIGFSELLVIAIVALIVIGPQRLPKVARTMGLLFGRMQRYVNDVKADISREMELDELKKIQSSMEDTARSMRESVEKGVSETEGELNKVTQSADPFNDIGGQSSPAAAKPKVDPYDNPFADPEPAPPPALPASPQGELPLEPGATPPAPKQG
jgi:sec-independent protein translocase protein TatB